MATPRSTHRRSDRTVQATLEDVVSRVVGAGGGTVLQEPTPVSMKGQVACFDYRGQVPVDVCGRHQQPSS